MAVLPGRIEGHFPRDLALRIVKSVPPHDRQALAVANAVLDRGLNHLRQFAELDGKLSARNFTVGFGHQGMQVSPTKSGLDFTDGLVVLHLPADLIHSWATGAALSPCHRPRLRMCPEPSLDVAAVHPERIPGKAQSWRQTGRSDAS